MNTVSCPINQAQLSCLADLVVEHFLDFLVFSVLLWALKEFFVALYIAYRLQKKNTGKPGKGFGTQASKIFMEIWNQDVSYAAVNVEYMQNMQQSKSKGIIAVEELVPRRLAEQYVNPRTSIEMIRATKNLRSYIVYGLIKVIQKM